MAPRPGRLILARGRVGVEADKRVKGSLRGGLGLDEADDGLVLGLGGVEVVTELDGGAGGELDLGAEDRGLEVGRDRGEIAQAGGVKAVDSEGVSENEEGGSAADGKVVALVAGVGGSSGEGWAD